MNHEIIKHIEHLVKLTDEEVLIFSACFKEIHIKKRQFIVQPNFTANYRNYILKGAFRAYLICHEGKDHTINIAIEDGWITDYNSYISQQPATMFVVALEDSVILQLDYKKEQELKSQNHKFETFFRILAEQDLAFQQLRIVSNLTQTAEKRYENYIVNHPKIVQRVPQYALASYLGMTTEFLSRIRNKKNSNKS